MRNPVHHVNRPTLLSHEEAPSEPGLPQIDTHTTFHSNKRDVTSSTSKPSSDSEKREGRSGWWTAAYECGSNLGLDGGSREFNVKVDPH